MENKLEHWQFAIEVEMYNETLPSQSIIIMRGRFRAVTNRMPTDESFRTQMDLGVSVGENGY